MYNTIMHISLLYYESRLKKGLDKLRPVVLLYHESKIIRSVNFSCLINLSYSVSFTFTVLRH